MHDPMTVAFDIKWPFGGSVTELKDGSKMRHRPTLITIWHVDPETDGSDDSCGWSRPNLTEKDRKIIDELTEWDLKFPYFSSPSLSLMSVVVDPAYSYRQMSGGDCLACVVAAWQMIAWRRDKRNNLTTRELWTCMSLAANPHDNLRSSLVAEDEESDWHRKERVQRFFWCVMRSYLRERRRWWQHPRWHFWHWKLQIHPVQAFKRWAFSRCCKCGSGFSWGYCPVSTSWDGDGPMWFRSERNVMHGDCSRPDLHLASDAGRTATEEGE
jgi:hypothetical protein